MPKFFLAGTGEKMQYLVHEFNDNTIRFVLKYPGLLSSETLCRAAGMLAGSVDVLHASFQPGRLGALWQVNREYDEESYFQHVKTADDPVEEALRLSTMPVVSAGQTQMRVTLVQDEQDSVVVLAVNHLCVDGSDGKYLLVDVDYKTSLIYEVIDGDRVAAAPVPEIPAAPAAPAPEQRIRS